MYNVILAPLDGSKRAEVIMGHVEAMAQHYDATVVLLQVVEPTIPVVEPLGTSQDYRASTVNFEEQLANAKSYLAGWRGELREKGIQAKHIVEVGPVVRRIMDVAERENADLVAMASHGRTGFARIFYGSVAAGLLHQTDRPLLLIRAETAEE